MSTMLTMRRAGSEGAGPDRLGWRSSRQHLSLLELSGHLSYLRTLPPAVLAGGEPTERGVARLVASHLLAAAELTWKPCWFLLAAVFGWFSASWQPATAMNPLAVA